MTLAATLLLAESGFVNAQNIPKAVPPKKVDIEGATTKEEDITENDSSGADEVPEKGGNDDEKVDLDDEYDLFDATEDGELMTPEGGSPELFTKILQDANECTANVIAKYDI